MDKYEMNSAEVAGIVLTDICHRASLRAGWRKDQRTGLNLIQVITRRSEDCKTNKIIDLETSMRRKTGTGR